MMLSHDHTIYLVPDAARLDPVCDQFRAAGFTVTERDDADRDGAATAQRLICFEDGSYIEILTIRDPETRARHRFASLLPLGEGWADYSLVTDDIAGLPVRLSLAGLPFSGPHVHARKLRDGRSWGVQLILAGIGAGNRALPFVLGDTEARDLRIPGHATSHANGITGIAGVTVVTRDASSLERGLTAMGAAATRRRQGGARFLLSRGWIDTVPGGDDPSVREGMTSASFLKPVCEEPCWLGTAEAVGLAGFRVTPLD
jgi:hypothetical protein